MTAVAIAGLVLGGLGLLCGCFGILMILGAQAAPGTGADVPRITPAQIVLAVAGVLLLFVLIIGCIGALMTRPWGRTAMMTYASVAILLQVANVILHIVMRDELIGQFRQQLEQGQQGSGQPPPEQLDAVATAIWVGSMSCGLIIWVGLAIWILIVMSRPHVKAAFSGDGGGMPPPPGYAPYGTGPPGYSG